MKVTGKGKAANKSMFLARENQVEKCYTCELWKQEIEASRHLIDKMRDPIWCGIQFMLYLKKGFFIYGKDGEGKESFKAFSTPETEATVKRLIQAAKEPR